ncbi:Twitching mobility protein [Anaerohalosphaera lusitana]|uniref:Twitching mobility protein n=1 Tax=Anaerohalosphaera lusitana TaxID=1936003 RepID=A0A1U9NPA4_9BACT|nr:PilT/PilU family type 4a pilus ATPase [Anaerohalosphaera lusitana]AQT69336.1 Twitching mobility protein [Anaerohalosphaera lusitana]
MAKGQPIEHKEFTDKKPDIDRLFNYMIKEGASDLHLKVGLKPRMRVHGSLEDIPAAVLSEKKMEALVFEILTENQKQFYLEHGAFDFAHQVGPMDRFRVNIFRQRGYTSLVARHITGDIPPFEKLNLPQVVQDLAAKSHDGIVLVTGPTGSGKSTTIASMLDYINRHRPCHIVTIEDPIEYLHQDHQATVNQREIGIDVADFDLALKSLMRQDPDVVLVGEMRDHETITAAMRAAETGHLVFGTLHASNAAQTVQRILDLFPQEERELARSTFGNTMRAIISQQLLKGIKPDAKRVPAVEILISNPTMKKLIAEGRENDIPSAIRGGRGEGMQDFTDSLEKLVAGEWVELEEALRCAPNVEELKMALKGVRASSGGIM